MVFQSATLSAPTDSCDTDSYLDNTEASTLTVTLQEHRRSDTVQHDGDHQLHESEHLLLERRRHRAPAVGSLPDHDGHDRRVDVRRDPESRTSTSTSQAAGRRHQRARFRRSNWTSAATPTTSPQLQLERQRGGPAHAVDAAREARTAPGSASSSCPRPRRFRLLRSATPGTRRIRAMSRTSCSTSPVIQVGAGGTTFTFNHRFSIEATFDGGVIETSIDGGASWQDIGAANLNPTYAAAPARTGQPAAGSQGLHRQQRRLSGDGPGDGNPRRRVRGPERPDSFPHRF